MTTPSTDRRLPLPAIWAVLLVSAVLAYALFITNGPLHHVLSNGWSWIGGGVAVLLAQRYVDAWWLR